MSSSVVRYLYPDNWTLPMIKKKYAVELGQKEAEGRWWKGFVLNIWRCLNKMCNRNGHKTVVSGFRGNLVLRLQNSSGCPPAGRHKSALPCLNDSCIHRKEEREIKEKQWRALELWRCFSSPKDSQRSIKQFEFLEVCSEWRENPLWESWWSVTFPTCCAH